MRLCSALVRAFGLLACLLCGAWSSARAEPASFTYLYIDANEDRASGGHTAIRFDDDVFHFQWDDGLLRLDRNDWSDFALSYRGLQNRSLYTSRVGVSRDTETRLHRAFRKRHLSRNLQLELLEATRSDRELVEALTAGHPSPVEIPGLGFFLLPQRPLPHHLDEVPSSPAVSALAAAIGADRHSPPLTTRRESLDRALQELEVRELAVRDSDFAPGAFPLPRYAFHARFADLVAGLRATEVLGGRARLNPATLTLADPTLLPSAAIRLRSSERQRLEESASALTERLVRLARGTRPDWGPALLLGMARLVAIEASLARDEWVLLDALGPDAREIEITPRRRELVPLLEAEARETWEVARSQFAVSEGFDEAAQGMLEIGASRWSELRRARAGAPRIRVAERIRLPTGPGPLAMPPRPRVLERHGAERLEAMQRAATSAEELATRQLGYRLITRNCVSEIFALIDAEMAAAVRERGEVADAETLERESSRRLGGRIVPATDLTIIPFVSSRRVRTRWRVIEEQELLSLRRLRARELRAAEPSLWVRVREANTLTSTLYNAGAADSFFVFFTDESVATRPLLGALNLTASVGATGVGLLALPFDRGEQLGAALRGALFSLPELAFQNIRKGTSEWVPPALRVQTTRLMPEVVRP